MTLLLRRTPTLRRWLPFAVVLVLAAGVWTATSSRAATTTVEIRDFAFSPAEVTVGVGDTVTWVNHDSEAHAVQGGPFNSPDIQPGESYSFTFTSAGDVPYICRIHTYMSGVVHVTTGGAPSTTTTTAAPSTTTTTAGPGSTTTTSTTTPGSTTSTTTPGSTTSTTAPDGSTTTTSTTAPPSTGSAGFQDVPDDPSAGHAPGTPGASAPPPSSAPQSTTTTTAAPPPSPGEQDVPDDPSAGHPPGEVAAQQTGDATPASAAGTPLGDGTVLAPYTVDGNVKVFKLTMAPTTIEVEPGVVKPAYAFNGVVPGPVLRVNEGDRVRIVVTNELPFPTSVHWHGMILPNDQDGVGGVTQPDIEPGARYTYEWTAIATGTHWYHTHSSGRHIGKGLFGALEVVPRTGDFKADRDYRLMLGDTDLGFVINGRSFPSTTTLQSRLGETVHLRIINTGDQVHAMHLHGVPFEVVAQDGNRLAVPIKMDTLSVAPAQTFDLLAKPVYAGKWLLHCHVFAHSHMSADTHPAGESGMNGMVTILDVTPASSSLPLPALPGTNISATARPDLSAHEVVAVLTLLALTLLALRTGRRRLLPLPLPPRKDQHR